MVASAASAAFTLGQTDGRRPLALLNASYDPTRELYREINAAFAADWLERTGQTIRIDQSHAASGAQARAVLEGLPADVVTLALAYDVERIAAAGRIAEGWRERLPNGSAPFTSTIVFLVREGNPKGIADWPDLIRPGVTVIAPNPKTSGGARWIYLAAWGYALRRALGTAADEPGPAALDEGVKALAEAEAEDFVRALYSNVPVLDTAARGSTITFVHRGIGDVLLAWESEALQALRSAPPGGFEIVAPSASIAAEPPIALVDAVVDRRGTRQAAQAYLEFFYSPAAQRIAARHGFRPLRPEHAEPADLRRLAPVDLFTLEEIAGSWEDAQRAHFADGGRFDAIFSGGR